MSARWVAAAGQEELARRMLSEAPAGWRFGGVRIDESAVVASYLSAEGALAQMALAHYSEAAAPHRTARFTCVARGGTPELVQHVLERVRGLEAGWRWTRARVSRAAVHTAFSNPDFLAATAGLKPALRVTAAPQEADVVASRLDASGLCVLRLAGDVEIKGGPQVVFYASASPAKAAQLRDAEAQLFGTLNRDVPGPISAQQNAIVGELLGYPPCCVASFTGRVTDRPPVAHDDYVQARAARVERPHPRLNNLLLAAGVWWIGWEPCRYDCEHSLWYANEAAKLMEAKDPASVRVIDRRLAVDVLVDTLGRIATVELGDGQIERISQITGPKLPDSITTPIRVWSSDTVAEPGLHGFIVRFAVSR